MISSATDGSGIGSVINRMIATTDMARTISPLWVSPSGSGTNRMIAAPTSNAMKNQRFSQTKWTKNS